MLGIVASRNSRSRNGRVRNGRGRNGRSRIGRSRIGTSTPKTAQVSKIYIFSLMQFIDQNKKRVTPLYYVCIYACILKKNVIFTG